MAQGMTNRAAPQRRSWLEGGPLATMRREMEELMEGLLDGDRALVEMGTISPRLDLSETDDAIEVTTDLPGIRPEEVQVQLNENYLTISAEHQEEKEEKPGNGRKFHRIERRRGRYSRSIWLPSHVDESAIEAKLTNGVLTVKLPKSKEAQAKKITVSGD